MSKSLFFGTIALGFMLIFVTSGLAQQDNPKVLLKTSKGDITLELYADKAPITVDNFLSYVDDEFYDGTIFHRVIKGFMIQGGGYLPDLTLKTPGAMIKNEATNGLSNLRGTIAMGRKDTPHTASVQFYINHVDNPGLDHRDTTDEGFGYCVFGQVIEGLDVVDIIANSRIMTKNDMADVPRETIEIISIRRLK